jgi:hypothetical protein
MLEIYVISNLLTKQLKTCGKVNRERDQKWIDEGDTSTTLGSIQQQLAGDPELQVLYLPLSVGLPNKKIQRINDDNSNVINKTAKELTDDKKMEDITAKEAEIASIQKTINAQARLETAQAELAALRS